MAKPWERYQAASSGGKPWEKYGAGATVKEPTRGVLQAVGDTALEVGTAAVGSVGAIGDFVLPGNPVSKALDEVVEYGHGLQSDVAKQGRAKFQQDLEQAEGVGDDLAAVGNYLKESPLQAAAQAAGSFIVPGGAIKGARLLAGAAGLGARGTVAAGRGAGIAAGAALGGGDAAGSAYELVSQIPDEQLLKHPAVKAMQAQGKAMPEIREELAVRAGRDASILPALAGAAAGAFGAEKLLAGGLATRGGVRGALSAGAVEGLTEAAEEGLTQYEGQRAAQEYDPSIEPTKNVAAMAAMGAAQGGALGAGIGAFPHGQRQAAREGQEDSIEGRYGNVARQRAAEGEVSGESPATEDSHQDAFAGPPSRREAMQRRAMEELDGRGADQELTATEGAAAAQPEFTPGQTVYIFQNGRSMPVEFVGYESNAAATRPGGMRIARVRTADGRGHFVNVGDLVADAPPAPRALPAADDVTAAGEGFVARPTFNIPRDAPRGIRNNNPGNIERGVGFQGEVEGPDQRFATFRTPEAGVRALARNLLTYQEQHGLNNVKGIISRWAPGNENNTEAYVRAVSQAMGVRPGDSLDLRDPAVLERLTAAIIQHENGMQPYPSEIVRAGIASALAGAPVRTALPAPEVTVDAEGVARTADQRNADGARADASADLGLTPDVERARQAHPGRAELAQGEPPAPRALPAPRIEVDPEGVATTADQRTETLRNQEQAQQDAQDLGFTPDVQTAAARHPVNQPQPDALPPALPAPSPASAARAEAARRAQLGLTPDVAAAGRRHPGQDVDQAAHQAAGSPLNNIPAPTDAQKEAGNYKKGHIALDGLDISIENPQGSVRSGVDPDGNAWSNTLQSHYGYIRETQGADGDHVDVFVKPGAAPEALGPVFAIDQVDPRTGKFDETKLMIGYGSQAEAEAAYKANYAPDWQGMGTVTQWDMPTLKRWIKEGDTKKPAAQWIAQAEQQGENGDVARPQRGGRVTRNRDEQEAIAQPADQGLSRADAPALPARRRAAARVPAFPDSNTRAGAVVVAPAQEGKSAVIVESQQTDTIAVGPGQISTPADAAHALASLRKLPQENVVALLTDKDGRPISVLRHTMSRTAQADVMPGILAGHTARFPDAAHVWLAHNHPSGVSSLSKADLDLTRHYADLIDGSSVDLRGMLAIAGRNYAFYDPSGRIPDEKGAPIPAKARTEKVEVVERRFRRSGTLGGQIDPANAPRVVNDILDGKPGLVFVDVQMRPVASLPMDVQEMARLKGTGGVDKVMAGLERANASGALINVPDSTDRSARAARNVATLLEKTGNVRPVDIIAGMKSMAAAGSRLTRSDGVVESRDPLLGIYGSGVPVSRLQKMVDQVTAKMPGASDVSIRVVSNRLDVQDAEGHLPSIGAEGIYFPSSRAADGTVQPARIYLMANALESVERANQVLAHELVGHFGMEAMLGENFSAVLDDVARLTAIAPGVKIGRQRPGDEYYATLDAVRQDYPDYSPGNQAREVLARMAETGQRPYFLERVLGYIRRFLRGLGLGGQYSLAEIKNMVVDSAKNLRSMQGGQAVAGALSAAESLRAAEARSGRVNLPDALVGHPLGAAGKHPDHAAAKAGDAQAAVRLVRDLVTPEVIAKVRRALGGQQATIVPVSAVEATGHNAIPAVTAARLGQALGLPLDNGTLFQSVKAKRSALGGLDRIFQQPEFEGPVEPGKAYFLVDDTLTQGGTLAALAAHIEQGGGRVLGTFALTGKQYSSTLQLSPETLKQVRERYGDIENEFRAATGRGFESLTESEGRYLAKHGTPDAVRNRILAEEHAARDSGGTSSVRESRLKRDSQTDQAPPSEGLSSGPLESRADTAGPVPADDERAPRHRGNVERPGENLGKIERELRQRTLGKMGAFSKVEPIQDRARTYLNRWDEKAVQGIFDQFAPLKNLDVKAYMQARLSKGTDGAVEAVFTVGKAKLTDGALDVDNSGGLVDVLAQLGGEHDHFLAWIAGNRAKRLKAEGRENLFTDQDIEILTDLNKGRMEDGRSRSEVYAKALKEFNGLQQSVLDVAQEAGLIDPESRALWEHEFYVPFYRVMEEDGTGTMGPGQIGGLVGQQAFKKLKGGQEKLGDLLGNTLSNWSHLLSASMKNMAAQKALDAAVDMGIAQKLKAAEKGSVRVMARGKERHYMVDDPLVLDALTSLHHVGPSGPAMKAMRKFKHYLTVGVTSSPTFRIRNLTRDLISAIATTDVSYNPAKNMYRGWKGTSSQSPTYQKLLAGGGAVRFGALNDGDQANNARRMIDRGVQSDQILDSQAKVKRAFRAAWDGYQELGDRAETINRAAIYEKAIKDGKSHLEASFAARDLMDFTAGGKFASVRLLTQVVPFLNARLQGMYKLGRAAKDDPRRFAAVTGAVAMASALFYLLGRDDEEYQALPDWVRNTYWVTRIPWTDKMFYIPKPFEVGALGTVVERMTELALAGDDYQAKDFADTLMHVLSDQLAMNPVPQLFKPGMYAMFNKDDFRGTNLDSQGQMRLPEEDRYTARTSAGAVLAGRALNQSPQRIEYALRGYFGWLGTQALNVADLVARPFTSMPDNPVRDMSRVDNWFIVGDFVKESQVRSSKYIQRFYDTQREVEQVYAAYSEARRLGDMERAIELAGKDELRLRPIYQAANKQMQSISRRIKQVDNDQNLDAAQKTQQREYLYQQRNRIAMMADQQARTR